MQVSKKTSDFCPWSALQICHKRLPTLYGIIWADDNKPLITVKSTVGLLLEDNTETIKPSLVHSLRWSRHNYVLSHARLILCCLLNHLFPNFSLFVSLPKASPKTRQKHRIHNAWNCIWVCSCQWIGSTLF